MQTCHVSPISGIDWNVFAGTSKRNHRHQISGYSDIDHPLPKNCPTDFFS